jgi:O-antigen/teichoic acid export membrane protein
MASIKNSFLTGSFWMIVGRGSSSVVSLLIFIVLARLLGPYDFGLVAFAAVAVDLSKTISGAGIPETLIREKHWDDARSATAFWTNILIALAFTVVTGVVIAPIAGYYYDPAIYLILVALSLTFLIDGAAAIHEAKIRREFGFKALAKRQVTAATIGGIIGIILAYFGFGYWALVLSRIVNSIIQTALTWSAARWRPANTFSLAVARELLQSGIPLAGARIIGQLNARVSDLTIGGFLGPAAIGLYRVGTKTVSTMHSVFIQPLSVPALSAFSRVADNKPIGDSFLRLTRAAAIITYPVYFGMAAVSYELVPLLFGESWAEAANALMFVALAGGAATLIYFVAPALTATGRSDLVFRMNVTSFVAVLTTALLTVPFGLTAVAAGFAAQCYLTLPLTLLYLRRGTGLRIRDVLVGQLPPFLSALLMFAVVVLIDRYVHAGLNHLEALATLVPIGAAIYVLAIMLVARRHALSTLQELKPLLTRKSKSQPLPSVDESVDELT